MNNIEIRNISMDYVGKNSRFTALKNVSLSIEKGEFVSILGSSGCGKSTLLSMIEGLRKPAEGEIYINGKQVTGPGKDRSIVFQNDSLFPWMTAKRNVLYGIEQTEKKLSRDQQRERAERFLDKVELTQYQNKFPMQLSGGQQQRVAIARALAMDTDILLMDEPFGALDPRTRASLQKLLLSLWRSEKGEKKTVVFVTHDVDEAIYLSDRIVIMQPNPGRIYREVLVPFKRPRDRDLLLNTEEYKDFRSKVLETFYHADPKREVAV